MIGLGVGVRGPNPLEPRQEFGVNAAKQAREFKQPEAKIDWARGGCAGAKIYRATTRTSAPSDTSGLVEGGN